MSIAYRLCVAVLAISLPSLAHLTQSSLKPAGGETFKPGDVMTIEWVATQAHDGLYDIYYSPNGGTSWPDEFAERWQGSKTDGGKSSYRWTIPANTANTTQGRIRVCQLFGGHCTQPGTYTIMSTNFTISNTTAVQPEATGAAPAFRYSAGAKQLDVDFSLAKDAKVSLRAYNAAGETVAEIPSQQMKAGSHTLTLSSGRLAGTGTLFIQLLRGEDVTTWTRPDAP